MSESPTFPELVEKVAHAIWLSLGDSYEDWDRFREDYVQHARAAIQALVDQVEHFAEDAFKEGWRDREARLGPILNSCGAMGAAWADSNARDALREALRLPAP